MLRGMRSNRKSRINADRKIKFSNSKSLYIPRLCEISIERLFFVDGMAGTALQSTKFQVAFETFHYFCIYFKHQLKKSKHTCSEVSWPRR